MHLSHFSDEVLARIVLPEGLYVVIGKAVVFNQDRSTQKVALQLFSRDGSNSIDSSDARLLGGSGNDVQGMSISVQGRLAVTKEDIVDIRCSTFNGMVQQASLIAISVDAFA